jgi:hypothetical protein
MCSTLSQRVGEKVCFFSDYEGCRSYVAVVRVVNPTPALRGLPLAAYEQFAKAV